MKREINTLQFQVDMLLKNGDSISQLDRDLLMEHLRAAYDKLLLMDMESALPETTESELDDEVADSIAVSAPVEDQPQEEPESEPEPEPVVEQELDLQQPVAEEVVETPAVEPEPVSEPETPVLDNEETIAEEQVPAETPAPEVTDEDKPSEVDFGFIFNVDDTQAEPESDNSDKIVHYIEELPEEMISDDELDTVDKFLERPYEIPVLEIEHNDEVPEEQLFESDTDSEEDGQEPEPLAPELEEDEEVAPATKSPEINHNVIFEVDDATAVPESHDAPVNEHVERTPEPVQSARPAQDIASLFDNLNSGFETNVPGTLGEKMQHEDNTLAAKLQQKPVHDLKSVIGINDKFLFVNELFGGSMERYNRSIDNLNDVKTLNGALIYLNELRIELQWNSSNEAYRKLSNLISRKFDS